MQLKAAVLASCATVFSGLGLACVAAQSDAPGSLPPHPPPAAAGSGAPAASPATVVLAEAPQPSAPVLPAAVDLRAELAALGLGPRGQGARGTCSIFTTCAAIELALARLRGRGERLSPEFLNWAASQAAGAPSDGNFFHNALAGFERFGICSEAALSYSEVHDPLRAPSPAALAEAAAVREESRDRLVVHWIVPWVPDRFGVDESQLAEIRSALARGFPVAAGSGHSRLLVGYCEDPSQPGGGAFLTSDSALARFDEVSFEFVCTQVADVFWIEAR